MVTDLEGKEELYEKIKSKLEKCSNRQLRTSGGSVVKQSDYIFALEFYA